MRVKTIFLLLLFCFLSASSFAQFERGFLTIKNYSSKDYKALPQNWEVVQDHRGVIYFANNEGLLEYKNNHWKLFLVSNASNIFAEAVDYRGYIFVGASNEFGYFAPDTMNRGLLNYYSLASLVPEKEKPFYDIRNVVNKGKDTYFASKNRIFYWNEKKLSILNSTKRVRSLYVFNNKIIATLDSVGIVYLENGKIVKFQNSDIILDPLTLRPGMNAITMFDEKHALILHTKDSILLMSFEKNKVVFKPFPIKFNKLFQELQPDKFLKINDNLFAMSSQSGGVVLFNKNGEVVRLINKNNGLKSDLVHNMFVDKQNNFWLALDFGLAQIKISSSSSVFLEEISGYNSTIECIKRYNNRIFIGTSAGLFKLDKNIDPISQINEEGNSGKFDYSSFTQVNSSVFAKKKIWDLLPLKVGNKEILLVSTDDSIVQMDADGKTTSIISAWSFCFFQDTDDPNRVFIGLDPGLTSIYYENGKWKEEGKIAGVEFAVRNISADKDGNLWLGAVGVVGVLKNPTFESNKIVSPKLIVYDSKNDLPLNDAFYVQSINGDMIIASGGGIFSLDSKTKKFKYNEKYGKTYNNPKIAIHRINSDEDGNVWAVRFSEDKEYVILDKLIKQKDGTYLSRKTMVSNREIIHSIFHDSDGVSWYGGTIGGLFRYDNSLESNQKLPFKTYIDLVLSGEDTLFEGLFYDDLKTITLSQTKRFLPTVSYDNNTFSFEFSAIPYNFESTLKYSWYLEGYDEKNKWTPWAEKTEDRYTNLPEGDYIFHVKAMDIYGNISDTASYSFRIKPPWYRTIWSYISYFLIFVAFVRGAITISTRGLRKIIKAATAEIQLQKDELEEKNMNIMGSIRYAKRIQEAVIPSDSQMTKVFPENFVLFRPRDIVSGDFYWMLNKDGKAIIAAADCTGHGVPGAFMSIMGISFLNEIANKKDVQTAADVLNQLRYSVITSLNQEGSETEAKDGMDISLCVYDFNKKVLQFAGAYNPLYMIRNGEIDTIKADRMPIGIHERDKEPFTNNDIEIKSGDQFYIMSDGYVDQFGGGDGKKFMAKRFKDLLHAIHQKPMHEQRDILEQELIKWRGEIEQIDDVLIIGIRVV